MNVNLDSYILRFFMLKANFWNYLTILTLLISFQPSKIVRILRVALNIAASSVTFASFDVWILVHPLEIYYSPEN